MAGYVVLDRQGLVDRSGVLNKDKPVYVTISNPKYWDDNGYNLPGVLASDLYVFANWLDFNEVRERFEDASESIKDFCDWENCPIELENPTPWDMAHLIQVVHAYSGLE